MKTKYVGRIALGLVSKHDRKVRQVQEGEIAITDFVSN